HDDAAEWAQSGGVRGGRRFARQRDAGAEIFVEALDARRRVHHVAERGIFEALLRAEIADECRARVQPDAGEAEGDALPRLLGREFDGEAIEFADAGDGAP